MRSSSEPWRIILEQVGNLGVYLLWLPTLRRFSPVPFQTRQVGPSPRGNHNVELPVQSQSPTDNQPSSEHVTKTA